MGGALSVDDHLKRSPAICCHVLCTWPAALVHAGSTINSRQPTSHTAAHRPLATETAGQAQEETRVAERKRTMNAGEPTRSCGRQGTGDTTSLRSLSTAHCWYSLPPHANIWPVSDSARQCHPLTATCMGAWVHGVAWAHGVAWGAVHLIFMACVQVPKCASWPGGGGRYVTSYHGTQPQTWHTPSESTLQAEHFDLSFRSDG